MTPRTGRPIKGEQKKTVRLEIRMTEQKAEQLKECAEQLKISRAEVIERGIDLVKKEIKK